MPATDDDTLLPFTVPNIRKKKITAAFDGGQVSSDGGVFLLAAADKRIGLTEALARLIPDHRDQALISTYSSGKEIDLARNRSVQQINLHINNINSQLKLNNDTLLGLQKESDDYTKAKKPIPASLQEDLKEAQLRRDKLQQSLKKIEAEKASTEARFNADKARYQELTGK